MGCYLVGRQRHLHSRQAPKDSVSHTFWTPGRKRDPMADPLAIKYLQRSLGDCYGQPPAFGGFLFYNFCGEWSHFFLILSRGMKGDKGAPGAGRVNPGRLGVTGDLRILFRWGTLLSRILPHCCWHPCGPQSFPEGSQERIQRHGAKWKWKHSLGTVSSIACREPRRLF